MKSLKIFAATLLLTGTTAFAQEKVDNTLSRKPTFGVKGGVNFATVTGGDFDSPDSRTSFHAGALAEFPLADIFSLQVEALYSGQGYKADFSGSDGDKAEFQLDYINVPVLAKFYIVKGLSIEAGPQFSFLVHEEFDFNPNSGNGDIDLNNTDLDAENFEFGVAGGLTFQTEFGLFASGRYNYGFTEIFRKTEGLDDIHNSVFQISVGYKF
ncbi:porin family protein [Flavobacterium silvaticum]|uniref:PorT family protein n=1 Tax=Flavobacterium silvaticum TaxID=1852020 RepID=A0A972FLZ4_9FLAO|nr:porin family protein [Flavobacterium silvaticum]NMH28097.1 PorT family protein [Flavobacterium silvaticum]